MKTIFALVVILIAVRSEAQYRQGFKQYFIEKGKAGVVWENDFCGGIIASSKHQMVIQLSRYHEVNGILVGQIDHAVFKKAGITIIDATGTADGKKLQKGIVINQPELGITKILFVPPEIKNAKSLEILFGFNMNGKITENNDNWNLGAWLPKIIENLDKCEKEHPPKKKAL